MIEKLDEALDRCIEDDCPKCPYNGMEWPKCNDLLLRQLRAIKLQYEQMVDRLKRMEDDLK